MVLLFPRSAFFAASGSVSGHSLYCCASLLGRVVGFSAVIPRSQYRRPSPRSKLLSVPQGGWETDETVEDAAARETVEEAGVRGQLEVSD